MIAAAAPEASRQGPVADPRSPLTTAPRSPSWTCAFPCQTGPGSAVCGDPDNDQQRDPTDPTAAGPGRTRRQTHRCPVQQPRRTGPVRNRRGHPATPEDQIITLIICTSQRCSLVWISSTRRSAMLKACPGSSVFTNALPVFRCPCCLLAGPLRPVAGFPALRLLRGLRP